MEIFTSEYFYLSILSVGMGVVCYHIKNYYRMRCDHTRCCLLTYNCDNTNEA